MWTMKTLSSLLSSTSSLLFVSRFLSAFGDRMWSFAGGLFVLHLDSEKSNKSLMAVALYGLSLSVSVTLLGSTLGNWMDRSNRLRAAKTFLCIQNSTVAIICALLSLYFTFKESLTELFEGYDVLVMIAIVIVMASGANLASMGCKIILEKDWVIVIADNDTNRLANINATFRSIDLLTFVVAPVGVGLLFDRVSYAFTAGVVAMWNVVSVGIEYVLLKRIYDTVPQLATKKVSHTDTQELSNASVADSQSKMWLRITSLVASWHQYFVHRVRNAGLSLSLLYMTVLGFDSITQGYALQQCVSESSLGILSGISSLFGLSGSLLFPMLRRRLNITRSGLIGHGLQVAIFALCVLSVALPGSPFMAVDKENEEDEECSVGSQWSIWVFLVSITVGRLPLWLVDLSVSQILQEGVEEEIRGTIGAVQHGLNSALDAFKFVLVVFLPRATTFGYLIAASWISYVVALAFFVAFAVHNWHGVCNEGNVNDNVKCRREQENKQDDEEQRV